MEAQRMPRKSKHVAHAALAGLAGRRDSITLQVCAAVGAVTMQSFEECRYSVVL